MDLLSLSFMLTMPDAATLPSPSHQRYDERYGIVQSSPHHYAEVFAQVLEPRPLVAPPQRASSLSAML
jgi:hypothetical protein